MTQETAMTETPETAFATALAAFQASLPTVTKDATGQVGNQKTRYADLASIVEAAFPRLAEHGLSYLAAPTLEDGVFVLRYALLHSAGHREGGVYPLPASATSQQIGSALTYARRYCLLAVTGLAPKDDDDDGAQGSEVQTTVTPRRAAPEPAEPPRVTDAAWIDGFRSRITAAGTPSELRGLQEEANVMWAEHKLSRDDAARLKDEVGQREAELRGELVSP